MSDGYLSAVAKKKATSVAFLSWQSQRANRLDPDARGRSKKLAWSDAMAAARSRKFHRGRSHPNLHGKTTPDLAMQARQAVKTRLDTLLFVIFPFLRDIRLALFRKFIPDVAKCAYCAGFSGCNGNTMPANGRRAIGMPLRPTRSTFAADELLLWFICTPGWDIAYKRSTSRKIQLSYFHVFCALNWEKLGDVSNQWSKSTCPLGQRSTD